MAAVGAAGAAAAAQAAAQAVAPVGGWQRRLVSSLVIGATGQLGVVRPVVVVRPRLLLRQAEGAPAGYAGVQVAAL